MKALFVLLALAGTINGMDHSISNADINKLMVNAEEIEISKDLIKVKTFLTAAELQKTEEYTFMIDGYEKITIIEHNNIFSDERATFFSSIDGEYRDTCFESIKEITLKTKNAPKN